MPCYCGVKMTGWQLHLFWSLGGCFAGLLTWEPPALWKCFLETPFACNHTHNLH